MGKSEEDQLICGASPVTQRKKDLPAVWKMRARSLGQEDPLEKGMATHISILVGKFQGHPGCDIVL